jgi:YVTN family beta-propeller protein
VIEIPDAKGSAFDHAAFDPTTRRVFIAHTARSTIEVIDHDAGRHIATLPGFPGAAGAVVDDGQVLVTNRGSASLALLNATTLKTEATFKTGARPNGAAILARQGWAVAACIGDDTEKPTLQLYGLKDGRHAAIELPGRPRWCVTDAAGERLFLCIRDPSMVLVARLPDLAPLAYRKVPKGGAHGLDIDHVRNRLYVACDDNALVEIDSNSGDICNIWPIAGPPGRDVLQSGQRPRACRDRRSGPGRNDRSAHLRQRPDHDRTRCPYDGAGGAGPALRDFTCPSRRSRAFRGVNDASRHWSDHDCDR